MPQHFAVTYSYGPAEEQAKHRPQHRAYLGALVERGCLKASGPFTDEQAPGALLIFEAESPAEVQELLDADPMVTGGAVTGVEIRSWNPVLGTVG
ncbi:YciI family protein [Rothia sp. AR01]|uniref:YciI family protein n=1 Tax=Rothia santali TaxID=2949643 RepID=A0A9X2KKJ0_9MICC|nr:YciI family protein [Rothia santali]MCP3425111.1 YciI family protein [Rothia santali]